MGSLKRKLLLPVLILGAFAGALAGACAVASAQSLTYGLGTPPSAERLRDADISISPAGTELPPGGGSAKDGAPVYAEKCAVCHGDTGAGGVAPKLVKGATPKIPVPCLSPCINDANVMAIHAPYATVMWDYINRGMPFSQEGSLTASQVYALTAFLLFKNGVIQESDVMDAKSLPQVKMPNQGGYSLPQWKHDLVRPLYRQDAAAIVTPVSLKELYVPGIILLVILASFLWMARKKSAEKPAP